MVGSKNAVINVTKNASVKSIFVDKQQSHVTINRIGKLDEISLNKTSELLINSKQNSKLLKVEINAKNCKITDLSSVAYIVNQSGNQVTLVTNVGELSVGNDYEGTTTELIKQYVAQEELSEEDEDDSDEREDADFEDDPLYWGTDEDIQRAKAILSQIINPQMTDYAKVLSVYRWLTENVEYDWSMQERSYRPEGALFYGRAVCQGYAETFQLFMTLEGVKCKLVSGVANGMGQWEGHAWNLVYLDGDWYHLDATWDAGTKDVFQYNYFLCTDEKMLALSHRGWNTKLPAANNEADFWSEYIELAGADLVKMNSQEEVEKYFNNYTEPGIYELVLYSDNPLWKKVNTQEYVYKRSDVLSYLSLAAWRHCGSYYFCRYTYTIEMKYDQVSDTSPELVNFVQNEVEMADKLDCLIKTQQDLIFTCTQSTDLRVWLLKWANQKGYYCNEYQLNNGITYETLNYETGVLKKVTIPRTCIQCSPEESYIDLKNINPSMGSISIVNTKEEFESLVAPLFGNGQAYCEFNAYVVPTWDCSEEEIMSMLNEIAVEYGYKGIKLNSSMTKTRVSYSNYCYHLYTAQFIRYK